MKITETNEGNIKIVVNREQATSLKTLLDNLTFDDYTRITGNDKDADRICDLWNAMLPLNYTL